MSEASRLAGPVPAHYDIKKDLYYFADKEPGNKARNKKKTTL